MVEPVRTLVPHEGLLQLVHDADGRPCLAHSVAGEIELVQAPEGKSLDGVSLDFDDTGDAYLIWSDDETTWVHLRAQLHEAAGQRFVQTAAANRVWLLEWLVMHKYLTLGLRSRDHNRNFELQIAVFEHKQVGLRVWWSWESLWLFAGFEWNSKKPTTISDFIQKRWAVWCKELQGLGLPTPTLRKARGYAGAAVDSIRCLPWHSTSIAGLLYLFSRFGFGQDGSCMKSPGNRVKAGLTLDAVLGRLYAIDQFNLTL